ncbi:TraR/DksA family transcriptional regulator [Methylomarinum vadi]|uniref:TraR/DksA family transcriptional regulator n=1 Tax=Methylomarinum vadi TaxID=438855 RepID=UPI0004DF2A2B|nr:TraR/DksA family transcriptional regulator [Methylomarinum vadi]
MTVELNTQQINIFKTKLNDRFMALRREISEELLNADQAQFGDLAGKVYDTGDAALADLLVDTELASIDRHIQEIRDIDAALMRIAEGSYGECCDCHEPIVIKRLQAYPTARRCVACQDIHDRTFAHGEQPTL